MLMYRIIIVLFITITFPTQMLPSNQSDSTVVKDSTSKQTTTPAGSGLTIPAGTKFNGQLR